MSYTEKAIDRVPFIPYAGSYQGLKSKSSESNETEDSNISQDYKRNKTRIPSDLNKILLKYGKKFKIQNQKFYECKKDNVHFMNQYL